MVGEQPGRNGTPQDQLFPTVSPGPVEVRHGPQICWDVRLGGWV